VLVYFAIAASLLAAAAWAYLLTGHGGYWRTDQRLPAGQPGQSGLAAWPSVVAVVSARDEAAVLPQTLPSLLTQDYQGSLEVVLVDDDSTDGTADVAAALGRAAPGRAAPDGAGHQYERPGSAAGRLRVVSGSPTPHGWAGKVWAMEQGLRAAGAADYVLLTDADIGYAPGTLTALVRAAEAGNRVLVSQMALLRADAFWERMLVPAFVYFFAQLYPFRRVNRPAGRTAAAAGGCMLVHRRALAAAGGLERICGARIDDVALGRLLKSAQPPGSCWLGLSTDVRSRRPYPALGDVWDMVARSAYTQLHYSLAALTGTVVGLAWLYLLPPAAALAGVAALIAAGGPSGGAGQAAVWLTAAGLAGWAIMSVTYLPMLRLYRLSPLRAPSLPLIAALYAAMTVDSALRHYGGRGGEWKGRTIPSGRSRA
jgi:hopene-associated glycosyltransferase HpnB